MCSDIYRYSKTTHVVLACISFMINDVEHFEQACFPSIFLFFISKIPKPFAHFERKLLGFLTVEFLEFFIYTGYKLCVKYVICKHFLPACDLSFHSLNSLFHGAKVFNFNKVQFIIYKK